MRSLLKWLQTLLAAAVVLVVPAYAACALLSARSAGAETVALRDGDDPLRNGWRVVDPPVGAESAQRAGHPDFVILTDWVFTSKGNPSPYK